MDQRKTIDVRVELETDAEAVFVFHVEPTIRERLQLQRKLHELAGGVKAYADLRTEIDQITAMIYSLVPEVENEVYASTLDAAWLDLPADLRACWSELHDLNRSLEFQARWTVLFVSGPEGWRSIADRVVSNDTYRTITAAFQAAMDGASEAEVPGNERPSTS